MSQYLTLNIVIIILPTMAVIVRSSCNDGRRNLKNEGLGPGAFLEFLLVINN